MSSVVLETNSYIHQDADVEMSDRPSTTRESHNIGLFEIQVKNTHQLFAQMESDVYKRRAAVITSFLSLMEVSPAKALYLINEASQDSGSQQFRDFILFKQIHSDMVRCRESLKQENVQRLSRTSSSNQQSIMGPNIQLDCLQWMFSFFNMYAVPFHHKSSQDDSNSILYIREPTASGLGAVVGVVLAQQTADSILQILNELPANSTRLGVLVNGTVVSVLAIDHDAVPTSPKSTRAVSIAQQSFDMSSATDFSNLVALLEVYLADVLNVNTVIKQLGTKLLDDVASNDDMESSPVPRVYAPFNEKDTFYLDEKFQTSLSTLTFPTKAFGPVPTNQFCVKKRSHFCNWERDILQKLKNHPYIIREFEVADNGALDLNTTMLLEPVRPLNKRLFSLLPTDNQGNAVNLTQQLLNTRFELLRQFIKQALHSIVYCHNNGIIHNNILSRGGTFLLDEQYRLKLMGFEHAVFSDDKELLFRDMRHLAVVFAELMFNVEFDVHSDDVLTDWSAVWEEVQALMEQYEDIVDSCTHVSQNDKMLYQVNSKTKKHMYDLLEQMFHTASCDYYHTYMYHSFVGMASSAYKEKSKQKLKEKTIQMLHQNKISCKRREEVQHSQLQEKWANRRVNICK